MATVIFYNFILFSSTFFVWLSEKGKSNLDRYFFLGVAFLLVFVPAAIRYDVGTDYITYLAIFESDLWLQNYKFKEPSFYLINYFYKSIGAHFQWMFATFAFIFTAVAFKAYPRKQAWLLHFLIFSLLWFFSFNGMRQAVALMWALLALFYFFDKRYTLFFTLTLIGATFHQSVLFIAVAGLAALIPLGMNIKTRILPLFFIGFIVFTYFSMDVVLVYIQSFLEFTGSKYAGYFNSSKHFISRDYGSGLGVFAKLLFSIYIISQAKYIVRLNKRYWLLLILIFAYAVSLVLANRIVIFIRASDTFVIAPIIASLLLLKMPKPRLVNQLVLGFFLIFLVLSYIKTSFSVPTSYSDPKLLPYQTIFELDP